MRSKTPRSLNEWTDDRLARLYTRRTEALGSVIATPVGALRACPLISRRAPGRRNSSHNRRFT